MTFLYGTFQDIGTAIRRGDFDKVKEFIAADPQLLHYSDKYDGDTLLHDAVFWGHPEIVRWLLDQGIDVNVRNAYRQTALFKVSPGSDKKELENLLILIEAGIDVNAQDDRGNTALHWFLETDDEPAEVAEGIRIMLDAGADPRLINEEDVPPYHEAICWGYGDLLPMFVESGVRTTPFILAAMDDLPALEQAIETWPSRLHDRYTWGWGLIHAAAANGAVQVVRWLLEQGIDAELHALDDQANNKDGSGSTPLHFAARYGHQEVIEVLLDAGATIDARNEGGQTPLMQAIVGSYKDHPECVALLLERGADAKTVAHDAAYWPETIEVLKLVIEHGADPHYRNQGGRTPLHGAVESKVGREAVQFLLSQGCDPNVIDNDGETPLYLASWRDDYHQALRALLEAGADPNIYTQNGYSPLKNAAHEGNLEGVRALLEHGADVNYKDEYTTALADAAEEGRLEIVQLLLDHGADVNLGIENKCTPLYFAKFCGYREVVDLLLAHGAADLDPDL